MFDSSITQVGMVTNMFSSKYYLNEFHDQNLISFHISVILRDYEGIYQRHDVNLGLLLVWYYFSFPQFSKQCHCNHPKITFFFAHGRGLGVINTNIYCCR